MAPCLLLEVTLQNVPPPRLRDSPLAAGPGVPRRAWLQGLLAGWSAAVLPVAQAGVASVPAAPPEDAPGASRAVSGTAVTGDLGVLLQTPARWPPPQAATDTTTWLRVTLQNHGRRTVHFDLLDTVHFALAAPDDDGPTQLQHGRDALRRVARLSGPVPAAGAHEIHRRVHLRHLGNRFQVWIDDGFGGWWWSPPLPPGTWLLTVVIDHAATGTGLVLGGIPVWSGHVQGPVVSVLI